MALAQLGRACSREGTMTTKPAEKMPLAPVACCAQVADPAITADQAETLASIFKALSDPHRVRIVNLLANAPEPVCACEFIPHLRLSQATVSFHLKKLLAVGLLDRRERGTWAYYSLKAEGLDRLATVFNTQEVPT